MKRDERGAVLPLTLIILLVLAALVTALLATGVTEPQIAANVLHGGQALAAAEAGAERQIGDFIANPQAVDCAMATTADASYCTTPTAQTTPYTNVAAGNVGTYTVMYRPISFATLLIESTGRSNIGGTTRIVRVVVTKHWINKFGVLGKDVEISGSAKVQGTAGAVHGNGSTDINGSAVRIALTATSAGGSGTCDGCADTPQVGIPAASGPNKPQEPIPDVKPSDFLNKALAADPPIQVIVLGGGSFNPAVPSACSGNVRDTAGNLLSPQPAMVAAHKILNVRVIPGSYGACTLSNENSGPFANWDQGGAGEWRFNGNTASVDAVYYASKEIKVTSNTFSSTMTPWKATLIAGDTKEQGKVEISGNPTVKSYFNDMLAAAGEIKLTGTATLYGTAWATSATNDPNGKLEVSGNTTLYGNVVTNANAKVTGSAGGGTQGKIIYNVGSRTRVLSPTLRILSWSTG